MKCHACGRDLKEIEVSLTKKLIDRAAKECLCITCLAGFFGVSEQLLLMKAREYFNAGCVLFRADMFPQADMEGEEN